MKRNVAIRLAFATVLAVVLLPIAGRSAVTKLPGEDGTKPALSPAPFPDRMSAYVWRNWGLVDKTLLAETVGAKPEDLTAVAGQMGLDPEIRSSCRSGRAGATSPSSAATGISCHTTRF